MTTHSLIVSCKGKTLSLWRKDVDNFFLVLHPFFCVYSLNSFFLPHFEAPHPRLVKLACDIITGQYFREPGQIQMPGPKNIRKIPGLWMACAASTYGLHAKDATLSGWWFHSHRDRKLGKLASRHLPGKPLFCNQRRYQGDVKAISSDAQKIVLNKVLPVKGCCLGDTHTHTHFPYRRFHCFPTVFNCLTVYIQGTRISHISHQYVPCSFSKPVKTQETLCNRSRRCHLHQLLSESPGKM